MFNRVSDDLSLKINSNNQNNNGKKDKKKKKNKKKRRIQFCRQHNKHAIKTTIAMVSKSSRAQILSAFLKLALLSLLFLLAHSNSRLVECMQQQQRSPMLTLNVPPNSGLQHLARSPASVLLASNFFDFERSRASSNHGAFQPAPPMQAPGSVRAQSHLVQRQALQQINNQLSSDNPLFSSSLDGSLRLDEYHPLNEIYNFIDELPKQHKNIQVFTIGHTTENRPIKAIEIINNSTDSDYVWLDALTHAREWITGTTMLYIIDQLVSGGGGQPASNNKPMIYRKNYIIIPIVNPDGYVYTWTTNRMWRKNRSRSRTRSPESKCVGADLNRNFDHTFGGEGASLDPCSHIYAGAFPFSEPETKSMADLLWSLKDRVKFYLTIHSFNQLWACPYAHTTAPSASLQKHMKVLRSIQQAVYNTEGELYEIGPLSTKLYVGSGFGIDFAYDKCGIEHSYLVELRDKGANGFVLPPDQIVPTARETFAGLQAGIKSVFGGLR